MIIDSYAHVDPVHPYKPRVDEPIGREHCASVIEGSLLDTHSHSMAMVLNVLKDV